MPQFTGMVNRISVLQFIKHAARSSKPGILLARVSENSAIHAMAEQIHSAIHQSNIPVGLHPYFQEYDAARLELIRDANLIIQRTLEYGNWEEICWLFKTYGADQVHLFLRQRSERWLRPVVFQYWRKLLRIRR